MLQSQEHVTVTVPVISSVTLVAVTVIVRATVKITVSKTIVN